MTPPRLVVFDVDGTLIDSQHLILAAMRGAFTRAGHPLPIPADVLAIVGLSLPEAMAALAPHLSPEERLALVGFYREGFAAQRAAGGRSALAPLYPGARAALDRLAVQPATLMGVATGKARPGLDHVFASHDLGHLFATAQTAEFHPSKPHPSMLLRALSETGASATAAVMVGDTEYDIAMGRAAGFATVGVGWGYHPPARLRAAGADLVIDAFDELDAALAALWDRRR